MARRGSAIDDGQLFTIVRLLASTDMTLHEIAQRFNLSRSAIVAVNRRFQVRLYGGRRSYWAVAESYRIPEEISA
jgi:predicted DNA-binding protein YlxM (UPF0122 family)